MRKREIRIFEYKRLEEELGTLERWKKYDKVVVVMRNGVGLFKDENGRVREVEKQWTVEMAEQLRMI